MLGRGGVGNLYECYRQRFLSVVPVIESRLSRLSAFEWEY